ncbi:aminotransferase class III [Candidatus Giovannonibacteria bacterium RIFCSPHIGHO2_01_FULL_45_33]|uniref:Aminotransferase class III n=1 Tax=Candidatus Giovannonibacteria bacterium RIFCSPLOWO2_01_FULL_45_34 TaxID=1798351 RepID=A0A1F5WYI1_9BACT|nr:MAG: aminotransferase class III [Candidatus Giovannonibacteria bacterium RIFCSPHIGHO2_01_FULL_45_33]OGF70971.1 MAG: aminotransferase class III [Candidatus Giovannonibacteria bacterium RIFCSPHIGHO2_02_FULL_44_11]OGF80690.1 MAG: aminotransferase class III [Candidatus Giovannonibacteria bacterium RIFCSPLOWO2_01_FULL_45_34]
MKKKISTKKGVALWNKAKKIIPGGNQLLSKRSEMFLPDGWPSYYRKARGAEICDLDGNRFIDMSIMGIGSCVLGYADPDVNKAVSRAIKEGSMSTLNSPEEVELAELLLRIHPWAGMVRYARSGGEAASIAVRIARAYTGRDKVAFCGYHGWHDWYLSANLAKKKNLDGHLLPGLEPKGVPRGLQGLMFPFHYNKIDELKKIIASHKDIGVIIMEPMKGQEPQKGFLESVRKIANEIDAVLIFDEITIGWKLVFGGAHLKYGVNPDVAIFAKAMSNGYPMAAVIGKKDVMQSAQDTFISSTYWTERIGPVAALATIKKMKKLNVVKHLAWAGRTVRDIWQNSAKKHGLKIALAGSLPLSSFVFDYEGKSQILKTLFVQEMLDRGFLASTLLFSSYAHKSRHFRLYAKAVDIAFGNIKHALDSGNPKKFLRGPVAHSDFKRLT